MRKERIVSTSCGTAYLDKRVREGPYLDAIIELKRRISDICDSEPIERTGYLAERFVRRFPKEYFEEEIVCWRADRTRDVVAKEDLSCLKCPGQYGNCSCMAQKGQCLMFNVFHECFDHDKLLKGDRDT